MVYDLVDTGNLNEGLKLTPAPKLFPSHTTQPRQHYNIISPLRIEKPQNTNNTHEANQKTPFWRRLILI